MLTFGIIIQTFFSIQLLITTVEYMVTSNISSLPKKNSKDKSNAGFPLFKPLQPRLTSKAKIQVGTSVDVLTELSRQFSNPRFIEG